MATTQSSWKVVLIIIHTLSICSQFGRISEFHPKKVYFLRPDQFKKTYLLHGAFVSWTFSVWPELRPETAEAIWWGKNGWMDEVLLHQTLTNPHFPVLFFFGTPVFSAKWAWESPGASPPKNGRWRSKKYPFFFLGYFLSGVGSGWSERETYTHQGFTLSNIWWPRSPNMTKLCLCW